jgi:hypothetical protein
MIKANKDFKLEENICYTETISSKRTEAPFVGLTLVFGGLFLFWITVNNLNILAFVSAGLSLIFLFYAINYRVLTIRLTRQALVLKFGIFAWTEPYDNIASWSIDKISWPMRYGGAGIHFMFINKRYRASFNFLEYPRVVVALKKNAGPVCDLSFTTRHPEKVQQLLQQFISP